MMRRCMRTLSGFLATSVALTASAASVDEVVQNQLSQSLVTSSLLTNGDAVRLGFWNFNPNEFVNLEDDAFGNEESAQLRQQITVISLPYEWTLAASNGRDEVGFVAKAAYLDVKQDVQLVVSDEPRKDRLDDSTTSLSLGSAWRHYLDDHWKLTVRGFGHWMRYRNQAEFRTQASRDIAPVLDGLLTNITVDALLAEPSVQLSYDTVFHRTQWQFFSDYHYMAGDTYHTDRRAHDANPEAWFWFNGAHMTNPLLSEWLPGQTIWFRIARVDLGGDLSQSLGNRHYYEAGIAWLVDTGDYVSVLDNIGIGINFNYGSVLRGGSLVLMLNEF